MANAAFGRLMAKITPRNDNYFVLFNKLAECAVQGSKVLALMSAVVDPSKFDEHFAEIRRIESEADAFHERVRQGFLDQAKRDTERWLVLSARETPEKLKEALLAELKGRHWLD